MYYFIDLFVIYLFIHSFIYVCMQQDDKHGYETKQCCPDSSVVNRKCYVVYAAAV